MSTGQIINLPELSEDTFEFEHFPTKMQAFIFKNWDIVPAQRIAICLKTNLENVKKQYGAYPDLLISGKETRRINWFDGVGDADISELYIPKTIHISASQMRSFFIQGDRESWQRHTNPILWSQYDTLRGLVLQSRDHDETASM